MSLQVEKLEKNMAKLIIEVPFEELNKEMDQVYTRMKNRISVPGFRKGKAPRRMIERMYGAAVFMEDAINNLVPRAYNDALKDCELEIVSQPKIDVTQMEPGKNLIFTAEVATKPSVTLGQYKGLEVPKSELAVSDEEVDAALKSEQEKNARTVEVEDRGAQNDDIVTLDYEGTVDGEVFDGGSAKGHRLTIGSGTFIPGFEEQLIGVKAGEHRDVHVTFPDEYHEASLAGKAAVFACDIQKVEMKELPELDDEFAEEVSEYSTFAEYRESVKKDLEKRKADLARQAKEDAAIAKAVENAEMDIPDAMIETQARSMLEDFASRMSSQGLNMEQYFQYTGTTEQAMLDSMKPEALASIRTRLVTEAIADAENIEVTEEDVDAELQKIADSYKMELDSIREIYGEEQMDALKKNLAVQKAISLVADAAVETDMPAEENKGE